MAGRPKYRPREVAALVLLGRMSAAMTAARFLINHDCDVRDTTTELLTTLEANGCFLGTVRLKNGSLADEYRVHCDSDGNDWYVKVYVSGEQVVVLLSCWWDGCAH